MNCRPRWYEASDIETAAALFDTVSRINSDLSVRRKDDALFLRMFGADDIVGYGEQRATDNPTALKFNLVRAGVNTAQAHIGALRPKPRFQTDDADWDLVRRAKACDHAVSGVFDQNDFYTLAASVFVDAAVCSLGGIKAYREDGKIKLERVFPGEILVDAREGYYGKPRNLYQIKLVDKDALKDAYPKYAYEIDGANDIGQTYFDWLPWYSNTGQVLVAEAWHLGKWAKQYKDGKHVISISNAVLESGPWTRNSFPFAFYRWEKRQAGFYGRGIVEELRTHQRTLNYIDVCIRDMMHYVSRGRLVVWDNAQTTVNVEQITNDPSKIIKLTGTGNAPTVMAHNAVPTEWWHWRRDTIEDGLRQVGFSEFQVSATKPPGIEAAEALRELREQGTRRGRQKVQNFEQLVLDAARLTVAELKEGAEQGDLKALQAKVRKGPLTLLQMIDWTKVALDDDQYQLTITPASSLPDTTAGRIQTVQDWYKAGFITQVEAKALLDVPDLERFKSLDLASYEIILDSIETMVEDGEYVHPEPTDDLELIVKLTSLSLNKFRLRKAPDERLELLRRYKDDAEYLLERAMQGRSEIEQAAAAQAAAVTGIQQVIPGGASPYEAARIAEMESGQGTAMPMVGQGQAA